MLHHNTIDTNTFRTLQSLFQKDYLKSFALAGGTSLSLQFGHRKSIDIDLFAFEDVEMNEIALQLENDYTDFKLNKVTRSFIFCFINGIKSDFVKHSNNLIIKQIITEEGLKMFSAEDIGAMKLAAICGRGVKKDFYDLYMLFQHFSLKDLLLWHDEKFKSDNSWMALRSLQYFVDAEETEQPELVITFPSWEKIKKFIIDKVNEYRIN